MHQIYNGGIERVYFNLAQILIDRGITIDLVVDTAPWSPFLDKLPKGLTLVDLQAHRFHQRLPKLIHYLNRERPAAMLSAQHFANEIAIMAAALSRPSVQAVVSEHTTMSVELDTLARWNPRRNLLPVAGTLTYRGNARIVAVSNGVARDVAKLFHISPAKIKTIYNPAINPDIIERAKIRPEHPWFAAGSPPVILGVGRLEEQKNFHNLIRAFGILRNSIDARLLILGEGSLRDVLQQQIEQLGLTEYASIPGFVDNPYSYLAHSSVFALSSDWEGLPTVIIEALAVGTPVVSTDCPSGANEILADGRYGALVPMKDPDALASSILSTLNGTADVETPPAEWLQQFTQPFAADRYAEILGLELAPIAGN